MNRLILAASAALMAIGTAAPVAAASINARQADQRRLIDAGARSGKLTPREVSRLRAEQNTIEATKNRYAARGGYSAHEKSLIHNMQASAGRHITALKKNGRRAPSKRVLGAKVF